MLIANRGLALEDLAISEEARHGHMDFLIYGLLDSMLSLVLPSMRICLVNLPRNHWVTFSSRRPACILVKRTIKQALLYQEHIKEGAATPNGTGQTILYRKST